jgi:hypothetical protein
MNLRDAFAGMKEAQELESRSAQAPKRLSSEPENPSAQAPKRLSSEPENPSAQAPRHLGTERPRPRSAEAPKDLALHGAAKSKHPEFEPVKIYVRQRTRKEAWRKWEDAQGGDFSDLVQMLLEKYLGA